MERMLLDRGQFALLQPDASLEDLKLNPDLSQITEQRRQANGVHQIFFESHLHGQFMGKISDEMVVVEKIPVIDTEYLQQSIGKREYELFCIPQFFPERSLVFNGTVDEVLKFLSGDKKAVFL